MTAFLLWLLDDGIPAAIDAAFTAGAVLIVLFLACEIYLVTTTDPYRPERDHE